MDTSFTNEPLIKKANKYKKKKLKQELTTAGSSEFESLHVPTDMLIDVSEHAFVPSEQKSPDVSIIDHPILIPKEIMDITFNEIISESIDMIVDQLDSTHLSESNSNLTQDQLSTRYSLSSTSTGILDKSHSFTPSNAPILQVDSSIHTLSFDANVTVQRAQVAIKKDSCIKAIKAIRHKKEYLKSIKADESSSNRSQHALSPPLEYTYDGFLIVEDIKLDLSIQNHEELLAFTELFMRKFEHFSSINYCSIEPIPSIIVKFSKHKGLVKAANYFKHGHHTGRMKLIPKTYYRMGRDKVSCREFKIINVSISVDLDMVEHAIRNILKGESFYLQHPSKHIVDKKSLTKDIFFTASSSHACNFLKQTWYIIINNDVFRLTLAFFKKSDLELRNKFVGKFSGFSTAHNLAYIKDHLQDITNLKNVYKRDDDLNIYFEFMMESDLFNAYSTNLYIDNIKLKGVPRGTNWSDRDAFLSSRYSKRPKSMPAPSTYVTGTNRVRISFFRKMCSSSSDLIEDELISNP
ncbi:hypothetical protein C1645_739616 [Glomus cerebriforme]|uniref:Uncharacterized protein n=1 Tax=Glomus cerebriforme TaxID=658196 RepID=A0A397SZ92_9GLOM|nr:hypothetical protein C1645_739616 [Glomus cerebriforme]